MRQSQRSLGRAATGLTYGLLLGLIAVAALTGVATSGSTVNRLFNAVSGRLQGVRPPPIVTAAPARLLQTVNGARQWAVGLPATSCETYRRPPAGDGGSYDLSADKGSGLYRIDTNGAATGGESVVTCEMNLDGGGYTLIHDYALPAAADLDTAAQAAALDSAGQTGLSLSPSRLAYRYTLDSTWIWTSWDDSRSLSQIGIPADYTRDGDSVTVTVIRSSGAVSTVSGRLEFWSNCYSQGGGNATVFDHDDTLATDDCYGSMQVHDMSAAPTNQSQPTLWAYNAWSYNIGNDDFGISGQAITGGHVDWTYAYNGGSFTTRRLQVYVR